MKIVASWLVALSALAWSAPAPAQLVDIDGGRFHVAGFGRVAWQPDLFELAFTVVSQGADARGARERHLPAVAAVRRIVEGQRAALSEQSEDAPRLQVREGEGGRSTHRFDTRFVLRVRGAEAAALLQQQLADAGVATFEVRPLSERLPQYGDEARRQALRDARRKAELIAGEMGWKLTGATAVKFQDERPWWLPQTPTARQYEARAYNYAAEAPAQSGEVTSQVDVEYAYKR
ncbi:MULTISPECIES: SIMPL domain-containing protein [unclassified Lysobacter]|uniref:SIMPL domain-containing protein n=1 Tax=unclassified Lysobacter TaxID=2635362 RepID=UPI001BEBB254|nr:MULTISPECIES: SIMPL domain-containing protein [unclassified Lysobacter]MBT2746099.1 SIMPL domain-containing protein [Lysobacter sp. ISL-42]MBT2752534.1 SIMPL domain-containing protein [Lysobacter sp. ISL-50]MBT2776737.1 SIMPL domain-containing protein [Lysobacter sp. ISL-54]